ncbi:solute carrier family 25 member 40 [Galendromus occidentalis]|uniref:Solute carrier family 25 member 40 n=1 Tax=Galendromus occidentalis TaxID=34638 RepID=A0AAJ6VVA5_9ACAR|nr:solute carrier family 25 member 40 [Galendromus occidentalis]
MIRMSTPVVPNRDISTGQRVIASSSGAVATALFMTPFDVVKVRLQSQQKALLHNRCLTYCNVLVEQVCVCPGGDRLWHQAPLKGTTDALVKIARHEGVGSLWSGLPPTLLMAVPATVIYFATYETIKYRIQRNKLIESTVGCAVTAGAAARLATVTAISPLEMCRTKLQSQKMSYGQLIRAVQEMVQARGVRSLYLGLSSTLLRDVPFSCLYWACYESLKATFVPPDSDPPLKFCISAGAMGGTVAAIVTLPFDVVKTHRQIELGEKLSQAHGRILISNPLAMLGDIYQKQGIPGLFAGMVPRIVKTAPACAIMISTYEMFKSYFLSKREELDGY